MTNENIALVNNTGTDISKFDNHFLNAVNSNSSLPVEIADLFELTVLVGYNPDGSNRGIVDFS